MFIIIGIIICIVDMKTILKDKKYSLFLFYAMIILLSILIYLKQNTIFSLYEILTDWGIINGNN